MKKISKLAYISGSIINVAAFIVGTFSSLYIYNNPFVEVDKEITKGQAVKACSDMIRSYGFISDPSSKDGIIEITYGSLNNWETQIGKVSFVIQNCKAMEMTRFCMGEDCKTMNDIPIRGITSILLYKNPEEKK